MILFHTSILLWKNLIQIIFSLKKQNKIFSFWISSDFFIFLNILLKFNKFFFWKKLFCNFIFFYGRSSFIWNCIGINSSNFSWTFCNSLFTISTWWSIRIIKFLKSIWFLKFIMKKFVVLKKWNFLLFDFFNEFLLILKDFVLKNFLLFVWHDLIQINKLLN